MGHQRRFARMRGRCACRNPHTGYRSLALTAVGAFLSFDLFLAFDGCNTPTLMEGIVSSKVTVRHEAKLTMTTFLVDGLLVVAHDVWNEVCRQYNSDING